MVEHSGARRGGLGALMDGLPPAVLWDPLSWSFREVKNSCDFSFSYFLDFYQDGLRRLSGNEYVLSTKSKFFLFNFLDHC